MDIKVKGNTQAQILAGIEPWTEATVSVTLSELSAEVRTLIAEGYTPTLTGAASIRIDLIPRTCDERDEE